MSICSLLPCCLSSDPPFLSRFHAAPPAYPPDREGKLDALLSQVCKISVPHKRFLNKTHSKGDRVAASIIGGEWERELCMHHMTNTNHMTNTKKDYCSYWNEGTSEPAKNEISPVRYCNIILSQFLPISILQPYILYTVYGRCR